MATPQTNLVKTPPPQQPATQKPEDYRAKNLVSARAAKQNKKTVTFSSSTPSQEKMEVDNESSEESDELGEVDLTELKKFVRKRKRTEDDGVDAAKRFKVFIPSSDPTRDGPEDYDDQLGWGFGDIVPALLRILCYSLAVAGSMYFGSRGTNNATATIYEGEEMVNIYK
mgnify:FL=1